MDDRVEVLFDADDGPTETIWAEPIAANRFRLDNIPFHVATVSMGDVVAAHRVADHRYEFISVVEAGGHSTYQVLLAQSDTATQDALTGLADEGCKLEHFTDKLIGIDVPPTADIHRVFGLLEAAMNAGLWTFDEMNFEHDTAH